MASITYFGVEKPQSTNFGVSHKNIEPKLTKGNWENKATCRVHPEGILYIQIKEGRTHEVEKDPVRPELDNEFRTSYGRKIYGVKYKKEIQRPFIHKCNNYFSPRF